MDRGLINGTSYRSAIWLLRGGTGALNYEPWYDCRSIGWAVVLDFLGSVEVINQGPYLQYLTPSTAVGVLLGLTPASSKHLHFSLSRILAVTLRFLFHPKN